jgi:lipid-A-disaccharide synthase-like uncharacterized protein
MDRKIVGTVAECLAHYARSLPPKASKGAGEAKKPLAQFADVTEHTVTTWVLHGTLPTGETLIRLRFFLETLGYQVKELRDLPRLYYHFASLIAFSVMSLKDIGAALSLSDTKQVLRIAHGTSDTTIARKEIIQGLVETHNKALIEARASLRALVNPAREDRFVSAIPASDAKPREEGKRSSVRASSTPSMTKDDRIQILAHIILAAVPIAEWLASNECSEDDRRVLREYAGSSDKSVFRLSNALTQLCGEKAREIFLARPSRS